MYTLSTTCKIYLEDAMEGKKKVVQSPGVPQGKPPKAAENKLPKVDEGHEEDRFSEGDMETDFDEKLRLSASNTKQKQDLAAALASAYSRQKPLGGPVQLSDQNGGHGSANHHWSGLHGRVHCQQPGANIWRAYPIIHVVTPRSRARVGPSV